MTQPSSITFCVETGQLILYSGNVEKSRLPTEIVVKIISQLDALSYIRLGRANRGLYLLSSVTDRGRMRKALEAYEEGSKNWLIPPGALTPRAISFALSSKARCSMNLRRAILRQCGGDMKLFEASKIFDLSGSDFREGEFSKVKFAMKGNWPSHNVAVKYHRWPAMPVLWLSNCSLGQINFGHIPRRLYRINLSNNKLGQARFETFEHKHMYLDVSFCDFHGARLDKISAKVCELRMVGVDFDAVNPEHLPKKLGKLVLSASERDKRSVKAMDPGVKVRFV